MKINRMEVSFWLHNSKQPGYARIYCRISVKGERADVGSTGITIRRDAWNPSTNTILPSDPAAQFKNEQLTTLRLQIMAIFNDLFRRKAPITAGKIKRLYLKGGNEMSFITAFELYLKEVKADPDVSDNTWKVYDTARKKVIDFLISEKALDLPIEDFDASWLKKFRRWMKSAPINDQTGHKDSYIHKHATTIKQVLRWAKLNHLAGDNPLEGCKLPEVKYDEPIYLTDEEFVRLKNHRFSNPHLQQIADVFIIYCRTGFHYSDLKDFVRLYQTALRRGIDGEVWLIKNRIKTEVTARVPQFQEVADIVAKYGGWERLPIRSNKTMNLQLKVIAATLSFHPDLSTKAGRKTFTDWCFNTLGLTTDAVKVMLGRKSAIGLEVYGRPDERRVIAELRESKPYQQSLKKAS